MKIGIISDTHDRIETVNKVMEILKEKDVGVLVHCGDFCAPFMMNVLAEFDGDVHCVFGNIDDRFMTPNRAKEQGVNFHGDTAELEFDKKRIAVNHFPHIAEALAKTGKYDVVFYGHNHIAKKEKIGDCWLVNPGEIMGWRGKPTYAIYDTESNEVEFFGLE